MGVRSLGWRFWAVLIGTGPKMKGKYNNDWETEKSAGGACESSYTGAGGKGGGVFDLQYQKMDVTRPSFPRSL